MKGTKNNFLFWLLIFTGIVLGSLIGEMAAGVPALSFLNYGKTFGLSAASPMVLDLSVLKVVFGMELRLTVASILGIIISIFVYKKLL